MKIIAIIATKNRINFLKQSLLSINNQIEKPDQIIVTSDSDEQYQQAEASLCNLYHATLIRNHLTKNYAGNLNTAITYLVKQFIDNLSILNETYLAFLDDDDTWNPLYLQACKQVINFHPFDFVTTGFIYHQDNQDEKIIASYPLNIHDFLKGNPGIQGSNTFIKLATLLKAGCFDEHLNSTTDRDLFTRVMMLHPDYHIINQYLVDVNATNDHARLTTNTKTKQESLSIFFNKYARLMNDNDKKYFKLRCLKLFNFAFDQSLINQTETNFNEALVKNALPNIENSINLNDVAVNNELPALWICVIVSNFKQLEALIKEINELDYPTKKMLFFTNWSSTKKENQKILNLLQANNIEYHWIKLNAVISRIRTDNSFRQWISLSGYYQLNWNKLDKINCIAVSRMILNHYAYDLTNEHEIVWIIDDDMEFKQIVFSEHHFSKIPLNIKQIISYYLTKSYDAVIGSYSNLPPLPFLSTLRTKLIDLFYCKYSNTKNYCLVDLPNYYYDLLETSHLHWEWMLPTKRIHSHIHSEIGEIFKEVRVSRKLFNAHPDLLVHTEAINRGGNTLIFNKQILKVPNISLNLNNVYGRRSDYFFVLNAKSKGFNIIASSFSINHSNRAEYQFDFKAEWNKFTSDLVGYSFTTAYKYLLDNKIEVNFKTNEWTKPFNDKYCEAFINRLTLFILNYYRINGILQILEDINYAPFFCIGSLLNYVHDLLKLIKPQVLQSSALQFFRKLHVHDKLGNKNLYKQTIENQLNIKLNRFVGAGCEGIVFRNNSSFTCYKYFWHKILLDDSINKLNNLLPKCNELIPITINKIDDHYVLTHPYIEDSYKKVKYSQTNRYQQIIDLQNNLMANKILIQDLKKENFIVTENKQDPNSGELKLIDYGQNIKPIKTNEDQESLIKGCYRLAKYWDLNPNDYTQLLYINYNEDNSGIYYDLANWKWLSSFHAKEQIHDPIIRQLINTINWTNLLDYGAGKCKITNALKNEFPNKDIWVYDVDNLTLINRKNANVNIYHLNENNLVPTFDLINCNKVLCCTNNDTNQNIINNINQLLVSNGTLILSICNPFFDGEFNTQLVTRIDEHKWKHETIFSFQKTTIYGNRLEWYRPFLYYDKLLTNNNFKIDEIIQDETVSYSLNNISDHLYFKCHKITKNNLADCTLLIKTNPMDHEIIIPCIKHIVNQLTKTDKFHQVIVVVDDLCHEKNRRFAEDDLDALKNSLDYLKNCLYIDEIFYASNYLDKQPAIYQKYFGACCTNNQSANGQQLFASLLGFELIKTKYVLQTDCDILYFNNDKETIYDALNTLKNEHALTLALSIYHQENKAFSLGTRVEVRTCLLDLSLLDSLLPLNNPIINDQFSLAWHQALDLRNNEFKSIRLHSKDLWFIHPENELKKSHLNYIGYVSECLQRNYYPSESQLNQVNLIYVDQFTNLFPQLKTTKKLVVYSRGHDVQSWKTLRWLQSLKKQTMQDFQIVYLDDNSQTEASEYLDMLFTYDEWCKQHVISLFNWKNVKELANFYFVINQIMVSDDTIIVNLDGDDAFLTNDALATIKNQFDLGADVSVGNCFNVKKPLRIYDHVNFNQPWLRNGDNIWLHPKCFLLKLAKQITLEDLTNQDHQFYEDDTDFAIMYSILRNAIHPVFIKKLLYLYDPKIKDDQTQEKINEVRKELAIKAKQSYLTTKRQ